MAIQTDSKVFPHLTPPPPDSEEELLGWAKDISHALDELNRQVVDKYNLHIQGTHSHPAAWKMMRVPRPGFEPNLSDTSQLKVVASATNPAYFVIGEARQVTPTEGFTILEATSDLTLDLDTSGVGGLDTGSKAADTIYYLYGVNNSGSAALVCSVTEPDTGPTGYTYGNWTYLGAFVTESGSAIESFRADNGLVLYDNELQNVTHSGDTTVTSKTLSKLPLTASFAWGHLRVDGTSVDTVVRVMGDDASTTANALFQKVQVSGVQNYATGWVPILTAQTIFLKADNASNDSSFNLMGWREDPTRWP